MQIKTNLLFLLAFGCQATYAWLDARPNCHGETHFDYEGTTYRLTVHREALNWTEANSACQADGARLLEQGQISDNKVLRDPRTMAILSCVYMGTYWVGGQQDGTCPTVWLLITSPELWSATRPCSEKHMFFCESPVAT